MCFFGVRVVWRLLVGLCVALFAVMSIYGDGPTRTDGAVAAQSARSGADVTVQTSGLRVMPLPPSQTVSVSTKAAPATTTLAPVVAQVAAQPVSETASANDLRHAGAGATAASLPTNVQLRWISADNANVRSGPSKRSELAGKITAGAAVHVMWSEPNGWVRVRAAAGDVSGFVHQSLLTDIAPGD